MGTSERGFEKTAYHRDFRSLLSKAIMMSIFGFVIVGNPGERFL